MSTAPKTAERAAAAHGGPAPVVEVVVPVHDEQAALAASIRRLHDHLTAEMPYPWRITIADNASTDATPRIARALADDLPGVGLLRLDQKGRGRALRAGWSASEAAVVAYMDVDLSTDLAALLPLVAPLVTGHSDVAIGTRLAAGSRVVRGPKRELISRTYNRILRLSLHARFSDAQCGFKAIRADVARELLPEVRDEGWFFDTELLVAAQRAGHRIHEVPVDWVDDPDSRVDIVQTARDDLRGVARLLVAGARRSTVGPFLAIGALSTIAYALLYLLLHGPLGAGGANVAALAITAVANTQANRRLTFRVRGREGLARHHAMGAVVFVLTVLLTSGALSLLHAIDPAPSRGVELTVLIAASICATVTRFVALKTWVFAHRGRHDASATRRPAVTVAGPVVRRLVPLGEAAGVARRGAPAAAAPRRGGRPATGRGTPPRVDDDHASAPGERATS
ncbi:bifunctional glycosyltransferase family 2/GtrA family protein [Patulibacter brassicae]|uniref:dolichyl-phosphate beta-glucosyltransferase n=1 Tax=Patulibacter brassicae TaxID=1705717 RepID=A0ABU4VG79_9ACTN|nr:bifunctional glycosyltransferase family 2/GtrA family protein [Patulibacter brassicae]MDX8150819.1 bifunctional glycosyltransferase family 2/GtrA family protein [Patulibacter brassicae]